MSPAEPIRIPSTDGVDLALHDLGGEGPPLLLVHATGFHARAYLPLAAALAPHRHVWAVDCRGHGASSIARLDEYAWRRAADDVVACLDHVGGAPIDAVGHSMGGSLILLAELQHPGSIRAAYLYEPILIPGDDANAPMAEEFSQGARRRRSSFGSRAEILARYAHRPPLGVLRADALWAYVEHGFVDQPDGTVELACHPETEGATFASPDKPRAAELAGLDLRLTVGVGAMSDGPGAQNTVADLVAAVSGAELITYPFLEHFGPLQNPDRIAADIVTALDHRPS